MPDNLKGKMRAEFLRIPQNSADAEKMVGDLKREGVDGIKAILQGDSGHTHFVRLERPIYEAAARATHVHGLSLATHTHTVQDVEDAIGVGSVSTEHGTLTSLLPPADFAAMRAKNLAYDPTLSVMALFRAGTPLASPLLQEIAPPEKLRALARVRENRPPSALGDELHANAVANFVATWQAGVARGAGSDAGHPPIIHGPTVQRELALWVEAGIPPRGGSPGRHLAGGEGPARGRPDRSRCSGKTGEFPRRGRRPRGGHPRAGTHRQCRLPGPDRVLCGFAEDRAGK